ncbi:MAG: hypothetical protein U0232_30640 [Thermomicrobiales bacterium]
MLPGCAGRGESPRRVLTWAGIALPTSVARWLPRYTRSPVLAYVDRDGWPVATRVEATLCPDHVAIVGGFAAQDGAPACLTYHRLVGNYRANDAFIIRGHFNAAGRLIPERLVGYGGTGDDRGVGSPKLLRLFRDLGERLPVQLAREGRPGLVARPTPKR